jgi:hypothetical protein
MKKVRVKYIMQNAEATGLLLEASDLKVLSAKLKESELGVMKKFIKSGESVGRLDHIVYGFQPIEKAIALLACTKANVLGTNPIYMLGDCSEAFLNTALTMIARQGSVFMNSSGGLCPVDGTLEILEVLEETNDFEKQVKFWMGKNSKVINLENDFEIERASREYMRNRFGENYAYIVDMKALPEREFIKIFTNFVEEGGKYVYVYTTGIDVEQMYEYSKYALQSGLRDFIFDFNCGIDKNIQKFIDWLSERANVEIISAKNK